MPDINYGDPEPSRARTLEDKHGDTWTWNGYAWETFETAPFEWAKMKRSWFPMRAIG